MEQSTYAMQAVKGEWVTMSEIQNERQGAQLKGFPNLRSKGNNIFSIGKKSLSHTIQVHII